MDRWEAKAKAAALLHGLITLLLIVEEILERV